MGGMFDTLKNAWKIMDLRKKILFTVAMLIVYRIGAHIPVPGIDSEQFAQAIGGGNLVGFFDIVTGGAFKDATIFAMSITPYINASIIMQLLTVAIPFLERMAKEGEEGRKKIQQYVRYGTVILAFFQATAYYFMYKGQGALTSPNFFTYLTVTFSLTAGTAFVMWLGEQITESGIGNGISLIIFAGIVSRGPMAAYTLMNLFKAKVTGGTNGILAALMIIGIVALFIAVIAAVIWVQQAERRIPIQYAKRVVGRKMYGGQSTHLPIKVNLAGVIPIIFAMSITMFPATIVKLIWPNSQNWLVKFIVESPGTPWYAIINALLIVFFTFFYSIIQFNPVEIASNMKKNGGFIPGLRPGKPTSDYISKVLNRITWFGGIFLALVTIFPSIMGYIFDIQGIWFGGTAVLILVGVALDTVKQMESQMLMRHYKGFLE